MGYLHIDNLYKPQAQDILLMKECYALEKIHGTSANIYFKFDGNQGVYIKYFSGGVSYNSFVDIFDFVEDTIFDHDDMPNEFTVFGEAYGGSCQKMSNVYGKDLKFVVFDVKVKTELGEFWLDVINAEDIANKLGLEFVHYVKIPTDIEIINKERDKPSTQAERNGMGNDKWSEGVILRPLIELTKNNGKRFICKHKREKYRETKSKREVTPERFAVLSNAEEVADEWVTEMRLIHVLDKLDGDKDMTIMKRLIPAMIEDVKREGEDEIEWSKEVSSAITRKTGIVLREYLKNNIR